MRISRAKLQQIIREEVGKLAERKPAEDKRGPEEEEALEETEELEENEDDDLIASIKAISVEQQAPTTYLF